MANISIPHVEYIANLIRFIGRSSAPTDGVDFGDFPPYEGSYSVSAQRRLQEAFSWLRRAGLVTEVAICEDGIRYRRSQVLVELATGKKQKVLKLAGSATPCVR